MRILLLLCACGFSQQSQDISRDLAPLPDLTSPTLGIACTAGGDECALPLTCFTDFAMRTFPGGFCTRPCSLSAATDTLCPPVGGTCKAVQGVGLCLPACQPGVTCRLNYGCCDGTGLVSGPGFCAPVTMDFCGTP
jgi:hypothetical protein